ncbi:uncharacterized protein BJ171DRAFT_502072 [Polychytrium aggregatum]|uniref:uncharacterized protein n=1 Tax=Polychytrium aggregatum TaxID=110093 RepID=UPI0022FDD6BF|nr:uncharacterized protein BJ171DRAFT_502072 [Polychytrium aggregatum]KAI9205426.1 hypothetical protein BJ171DRAFT_502072 [Polychytrium aggregatum]
MYTHTNWRRQLEQSFAGNGGILNCSFAQLATIGTDGRPANRTVVIRGIHSVLVSAFPDSPATGSRVFFEVATDRRSNKCREILHNNFGELCMYFSGTWEQFRFAGRLYHIHNQVPQHAGLAGISPEELEAERYRVWKYVISENTRQSFVGPTPGTSTNNFEDQTLLSAQVEAKSSQTSASDLGYENFSLLLFEPDRVDYLQLSTRPHSRTIFKSSPGLGVEQWSFENVNP